MAITQKELAELAGVSRPAFSMYLNDPETSHLSESKKQKLAELMRRYNYSPNLAARSLRGKKIQLVGIAGNLFLVPIHSAMIEALNRILWAGGYQTLLGDFPVTGGNDGVQSVLREFTRRGVDVLFLFNELPCGGSVDFTGAVIRITENHPHFDLCTDLREAGRIAVRHLLAVGRKRLAYVALPNSSHKEWRCRGMSDVLHEAGIPVTPDELFYPLTPDLAERLRRDRVDGVFCVNESVAARLYQLLHAAGMRIPEDVAVVGFDGLPLAGLLDPPLTTIVQPIEAIASSAVELMNTRLAGQDDSASTPRWFKPELLVRDSSRIPR